MHLMKMEPKIELKICYQDIFQTFNLDMKGTYFQSFSYFIKSLSFL